MNTLKELVSRALIALFALSVGACASVSIDRSDIQDGSRLIVLSNLEDRMFINDVGLTIFERQDDAYIPLHNWGLADVARQAVIRTLQSDSKFNVVDNNNRGAQKFSEHVEWELTNFGKLAGNAQRVQGYCVEEGANYLLLIQPGFAKVPMVTLPANRGFGYDQRRAFGKRTSTTVGYSSIVLLYDCITGKEIQGVNEVIWHDKNLSESLEPRDLGIYPEIEAMRVEHTERYMAVVKAAVEKIEVFSLP